MLIDTHCHLDLLEKNLSLKEILKECYKNQVLGIIQIATDIDSSKWNQNFIEEFYKKNQGIQIFWTGGLHPESVKEPIQIKEMCEFIKKNYKEKHFVGIGETGLDFYYNQETKEIQKESFYKHLLLAKELNLPIIIHCRDDKQYNETKLEAIESLYQIAKELHHPKGIMHCFTYSYKEAKRFLDLGWYISFSGILTFKNAIFLQDCAKKIPISKILIETDSPFLAAVPHRGKINQPAYLVFIFDFLSKLLNIKKENLSEILNQNTKSIFNL